MAKLLRHAAIGHEKFRVLVTVSVDSREFFLTGRGRSLPPDRVGTNFNSPLQHVASRVPAPLLVFLALKNGSPWRLPPPAIRPPLAMRYHDRCYILCFCTRYLAVK